MVQPIQRRQAGPLGSIDRALLVTVWQFASNFPCPPIAAICPVRGVVGQVALLEQPSAQQTGIVFPLSSAFPRNPSTAPTECTSYTGADPSAG